MAKLDKGLKAILDKYEIEYNDKTKLWDCHGTLVLYHKAYEIIAAKEKIVFDVPQIVESNSKDKIVCVLVTGHMGERSEWSFGESAPNNCKNAYPYAMAEKRAKDRVIAKLVGLSQYVYSEDEADDFKDNKPNQAPLSNPPVQKVQKITADEANQYKEELWACKNMDELKAEWSKIYEIKSAMTKAQFDVLEGAKDNRKAELEKS